MQASMQHKVLADAIFPDLGSQTKVGSFVRDAVLVLGFTLYCIARKVIYLMHAIGIIELIKINPVDLLMMNLMKMR